MLDLLLPPLNRLLPFIITDVDNSHSLSLSRLTVVNPVFWIKTKRLVIFWSWQARLDTVKASENHLLKIRHRHTCIKSVV